jgi:hypothetical protein
MATLKTFLAHSAMLPNAWVQRVNTETHHGQGDVMIIATTKAAAVEMLMAAGTSQFEAESIVGQARIRRDSLPTSHQAVVAAGIADQSQPGAFAWRRSAAGNPIARVDVSGLPIVAHFRMADTGEVGLNRYRLNVEPVSEEK